VIGWLDETPEQPRPLTLRELHHLRKTGFGELANRLAAGTCPSCSLNRLSGTHRATCEAEKPDEAQEPVRQPWESRRAA
jgi:hypothetical protein